MVSWLKSVRSLFKRVASLASMFLGGMLHEAAVGKLEQEFAERRVAALIALSPEAIGLPGLTPLISAEALLVLLSEDPSTLERAVLGEVPHLHA